ncbi:MAG: hypothetical protein ACREF9_14840, partial [Opitutaceae bacterium]
ETGAGEPAGEFWANDRAACNSKNAANGSIRMLICQYRSGSIRFATILLGSFLPFMGTHQWMNPWKSAATNRRGKQI